MVQVDAALGRAGAARGVQPEGRRIPAGRLGFQIGGSLGQQPVEPGVRAGRLGAAHHIDVAKRAPLAGGNLLDLGQKRGAHDQHTRTRIVNDVLIVGRLPQRVQRNRHRARLDRAEEAVDEIGAVEEKQQDALLGPDVDSAQRTAEPIHASQHLVVGDTGVAAFDRDVRAAPFLDVAVDEMGRDVERLGDTERFRGHGGTGHRRSLVLGPWSVLGP